LITTAACAYTGEIVPNARSNSFRGIAPPAPMIAVLKPLRRKSGADVIDVHELTKVYRVPLREPGLRGSIRSLWHREHKEVRAVDRIQFQVQPGERVGFLGSNGAGKTTTLKMLTGLLHPTSGRCSVLGWQPQQRKREFLRSITLVMGQKQQLIWDLPAIETFQLNRAMFDIPSHQFQDTLQELTRLLALDEFLQRPVRNLSLGQRMRCELAAALLHRPKVLFLDEPTIGMDVEVQAIVREFILAYNRRYEATIVLTSHDMADVARMVRRVILIDRGVIRYDGSLDGLHRQFASGRTLVVKGDAPILHRLGFTPIEDERRRLTVAPEAVNEVLTQVLRELPQAELTVVDPPLDEVLRRAFGERA